MSGNGELTVANDQVLRMATDIVSAYVKNNPLSSTQVSEIIRTVYGSLRETQKATDAAALGQKPAVTIRRSVRPDHLICLEDGKKLKMLKRYLRSTYGMTPDEYRAKWGLPPDYPMVAPDYSRQRSEFAKKIGLGRKRVGMRRRGRRMAK